MSPLFTVVDCRGTIHAMLRLAALMLVVFAVTPALAEAIAYKGRTITVGNDPGREQFVELAKRGIDMAGQLPADLRALAELVPDLRYTPAAEAKPNRDPRDNVTGVYTMVTPDDPRVFLAFNRNPAFLAPVDVTLSLVGNGVTARRHREYLALKAKGGDPARQQYLKTVLTLSDPDVALKARCENLEAIFKAMKALKIDSRKTDGLARLLSQRGC